MSEENAQVPEPNVVEEVVTTGFVSIDEDLPNERPQEVKDVEKEEVIIPAEYGSVEWHNLVSELNTLGVLMGSTYQQPKFGPGTRKNPQGEVMRTIPANIYSPGEIYRMKMKADKIMQKLGW